MSREYIPKQRTTIDIPVDDHRECMKHGWKFIEVFKLGMDAKRGNPGLIKRLGELEIETERLRKNLHRAVARIIEMEGHKK